MKCPVCGAKCMRHHTGKELGTQLTPWRCTECDWDEEYDKAEEQRAWKLLFEKFKEKWG
jgi:transposase-like protein